jgi:hypothetical protein
MVFSYLRLRCPLEEAMARYGRWIGKLELGPPRDCFRPAGLAMTPTAVPPYRLTAGSATVHFVSNPPRTL